MRDDLVIQRVREAIRKRALMSPEARFQQMIDRGVIDEKGNVLLRMPEPPPAQRKRKAKKRSRKPKGD